jgi:hypothetical protein
MASKSSAVQRKIRTLGDKSISFEKRVRGTRIAHHYYIESGLL